MEITTFNLKALRYNMNWDLKTASKHMGCTPQTLNTWENNPEKVLRKHHRQISKVYGVPIELIRWSK